MQQKNWSCFHTHSVILCTFIGIWDCWCLEVSVSSVCWFLLPCVVSFYSIAFDLLVWHYLFLVFLWVLLISSGWSFPSSDICSAGFVERLWLNFGLLWNCFVSLSVMIQNFSEYSSLGCNLWSLRIYRISVQASLAFKVSIISQVSP